MSRLHNHPLRGASAHGHRSSCSKFPDKRRHLTMFSAVKQIDSTLHAVGDCADGDLVPFYCDACKGYHVGHARRGQ